MKKIWLLGVFFIMIFLVCQANFVSAGDGGSFLDTSSNAKEKGLGNDNAKDNESNGKSLEDEEKEKKDKAEAEEKAKLEAEQRERKAQDEAKAKKEAEEKAEREKKGKEQEEKDKAEKEKSEDGKVKEESDKADKEKAENDKAKEEKDKADKEKAENDKVKEEKDKAEKEKNDNKKTEKENEAKQNSSSAKVTPKPANATKTVVTNRNLVYCQGQKYEMARNYSAAMNCYLRAAKLGHVSAQIRLANMYRLGLGKLYSQPFHKYFLFPGLNGFLSRTFWALSHLVNPKIISLTNQGSFGLNFCFPYQKRIAYSEAAKWYLLAAKKGHPFAMLSIANFYKNGTGILKNNVMAYKWFWLANSKLYHRWYSPFLSKYWMGYANWQINPFSKALFWGTPLWKKMTEKQISKARACAKKAKPVVSKPKVAAKPPVKIVKPVVKKPVVVVKPCVKKVVASCTVKLTAEQTKLLAQKAKKDKEEKLKKLRLAQEKAEKLKKERLARLKNAIQQKVKKVVMLIKKVVFLVCPCTCHSTHMQEMTSKAPEMKSNNGKGNATMIGGPGKKVGHNKEEEKQGKEKSGKDDDKQKVSSQ